MADIARLITQLYSLVENLEAASAGSRKFTLDGHLVGSIGDVLAADAYGLKLVPQNSKGFDALWNGKKVEIKTTQCGEVAFRSVPEILLVLQLRPDGTAFEAFNGPGAIASAAFRTKGSNGQMRASLNRLRERQDLVPAEDRVPRRPGSMVKDWPKTGVLPLSARSGDARASASARPAPSPRRG